MYHIEGDKMCDLTADELESGDELRDVDGHGRNNPHGPDMTDKIVVRKPWHGDAWLFGVRLENGRVSSGGSKSFALSYDEINARLESGRYQTVDVEVDRTLDVEALPVSPDDDVYVRFGDIPEGERSYNHTDECHEDGVSVYDAEIESVPQESDAAGMFVPVGTKTLQIIMLAQRDTYLVTGEEVGTGVDGEPLLRDVDIVAELEGGDEESGWIIKEDE